MADIYIKSSSGTQNSGTYRGIWLTAGNWAVGDRVMAVNLVSYRVHECTTAGGGDAAEPTWNTSTAGTTTMTAGAVFTTRIPDTWANSTIDLTRAAANDAVGDSIYVSASYSETPAGVTHTWAGTLASPSKILCVNDSGDPTPPTALAKTAIVASQSASAVTINGTFICYGIIFKAGVAGTSSSSSIVLCNNSNDWQLYRECEFWLANTVSSTPKIFVGSATSVNNQMTSIWERCNVKFNLAGHGVTMYRGHWEWNGGSILSGSVAITTLFAPQANCTFDVRINDVDMTEGGAAMNLFLPEANSRGKGVVRNCTMPTGWTGSLGATPTGYGCRLEMYNCDAAGVATNYRCQVKDYAGTLTTDDALYRAPGLGASSWMHNGTTQVVGISHKYTATANAEYPAIGFRGIPLAGLNTTVVPTTSHVVTCYFTTPGQADFTPLSDKDIGLEVEYAGTADKQHGKYADDIMVMLATEADQTADTAGDWDDALGAWTALTAYSVGAVVRPVTRNGKTYYCSVAGTSGAVEPTWTTTEGNANTDATVTWRCMHRQKMVVTLGATAGKVQERGFMELVPVLYLASAVAWVDPVASVTSS